MKTMSHPRGVVTALAATAVAIAITGIAIADSATAAPATRINNCPGSSLAVTHHDDGGGAGHSALTLRFRNRSDHRCIVQGYPGFDALGKHGHVLAHATRTTHGYLGGSTHGVPTVVLEPGHYASAVVEWVNATKSGGACTRSTSIAYTVPNTAKTLHRAGSVARCGLTVHPAVPGKSGDLE